MKMGQAHFETRTVRFQRTLSDSGILLKGSHVAMDQVTVRTFLVGYNGDGWDRLFESRSVVTDPLTADPVSLPLSGNEVIGLRLSDHLRNIVLGRADNSINISYYEPLLDSPVDLVISDPLPGITNLDGQEISGTWIESRLSDSDSVVVRSFFDKKGTLWVEEYPTIHQIRRRMPGPLSLSSETSELLVGLYSEAYVSDLNAATRAKYRLKSTPDRLDSLDLLGVPLNHKLVRESPDVLVLEVKAGAPDSDDPPNKKADLGASRYVQPNSKEIIGALRYLRSAGKRGRLTRDRRYNATPVVARASLIQRPKRFWSDPERVAGLIMHYVSALLPDKRHTFSMADAVTTLSRGSGDCTEHAVLFASLMRAHKIPTRLVAGMQLTRGGMWGYHMWNSYWNGSSWKSIDPSTMSYRPGALYVALGRGAAEFDELRDHLADFMWRTFTGVSFNLVEASNTGEKLFLARPRSPDQNVKEIALFNAVVLSERGDHEGAISVIDEHIPKDRRSLSIKLMRIELLVRSGKHDVALKSIDSLRDQTSDSQNTDLLDKFELKCLLTMGRFKRADEVYRRIDKQLAKSDSEPARTLLQAELLFGRKDESRAIELLEKALDKHPDNTSLLSAFAEYVTTSDWVSGDDLLERALKAAHRAANETLLSEHEVLATLARVLIRTGRLVEADRIIDHALILAPSDRTLHELRGKLPAKKCPLTIRKQQDN
ncbi:MAG: tetratricopeptide repeat protein [Proteobacteria bacterium]|nr:tetratricopeptide repeat protein [Pseudomonadota bacterium]